MKRIFLLCLILLQISVVTVRGQAALLVLIFGEKAASENFHFSMKAGLNYSIITGTEDGKNRLGANFGLVNNIKLTEKLSLTPEFIPLSQKGIRNLPVLSTGNPDMDSLLIHPSSTDRKLGYIDIPILLKYKLSRRWSIAAGPQVSFLTSAVDVYKSSPINDVILTTEVDIEEAIKKVDFGLAIDLTYRVSEHLAGKGLDLFFRYNQGFTDMVKDNTGTKRTDITFQIGAAFPFVEKQE